MYHACRGKVGTSSLATGIDCMVVPFGLQMVNGMVAWHLLIIGSIIVQNVPVVPLLAIKVVVRGPIEVMVVLTLFILDFIVLGSPHHQSLVGGVCC